MCDSEWAGLSGIVETGWGTRSRNSTGDDSSVEARSLTEGEKEFRRGGARVGRKLG